LLPHSITCQESVQNYNKHLMVSTKQPAAAIASPFLKSPCRLTASLGEGRPNMCKKLQHTSKQLYFSYTSKCLTFFEKPLLPDSITW
jgi:hypothetical protein